MFVFSLTDVHNDQFTGIEIEVLRLLDFENYRQNANIHALLALIRELDLGRNKWLHTNKLQQNLDIGAADGHLRRYFGAGRQPRYQDFVYVAANMKRGW